MWRFRTILSFGCAFYLRWLRTILHKWWYNSFATSFICWEIWPVTRSSENNRCDKKLSNILCHNYMGFRGGRWKKNLIQKMSRGFTTVKYCDKFQQQHHDEWLSTFSANCCLSHHTHFSSIFPSFHSMRCNSFLWVGLNHTEQQMK